MKFDNSIEKTNKINPIETSPIPEYIELNEKEGGIPYYYKNEKGKIKKALFKVYKDIDENSYVEKNPNLKPYQQNLKTEYMISLLIKGTFHSSDVFKKNDKYFSKIIDLNKIKKPEYGELESEIFLLRYLFSDWDKNFPKHNMQYNDGNFAHYDYSESLRGAYEEYFRLENSADSLTKKIQNELDNISKYGESWGLKRKAKTFFTKIGIPLRKKEPDIEKQI